MTLDALAEQAGISASHLSRLERSQTLPSFTVLAKIAEVLGVGVDEFVRLERDVTLLDEELGRYLDYLAIDAAARDELFDLSIEARRALVTRLRQLSEAGLTTRAVQEAAAAALAEPQIEAACATLNRLVRQQGMTGPAFGRAWMRLVETPGMRRSLVTAASLALVPPEANMLAAYRTVFRDEPIDPWVVAWWTSSEWLHDATVVRRWPVRMLVSSSGLAGMLGRGDERLGAAASAERLGRLVERLAHDQQFELAVADVDFGSCNLLLVDDRCGLVERLPERRTRASAARAGLWLAGLEVVQPGVALFDRLWEGLPAEARDRARVIDRLRAEAERQAS